MKTIIEMARLPDIKRLGDTISRSGVYGYTADQMREYAALVRAEAQAEEREAMVAEAAKQGWAMRNDDPFEDCVREIADIRARGNT